MSFPRSSLRRRAWSESPRQTSWYEQHILLRLDFYNPTPPSPITSHPFGSLRDNLRTYTRQHLKINFRVAFAYQKGLCTPPPHRCHPLTSPACRSLPPPPRRRRSRRPDTNPSVTLRPGMNHKQLRRPRLSIAGALLKPLRGPPTQLPGYAYV